MRSELIMSRSRAGEVAGTREEERRLAQQTARREVCRTYMGGELVCVGDAAPRISALNV